jgi:hypothetical protein
MSLIPQKLAIYSAKIFFAARDPVTGAVSAFTWFGNVNTAKVTAKSQVESHKEGYTGQGLTDAHVVTSVDANISLEIDNISSANVQLGLYGAANNQTTGTVSAEAVGSASTAVGDHLVFQHVNVSSVVLTDSSSTPKNLVAGTHYNLNAPFGSIDIIALPTGFTGPVEAAYTYGASSGTDAFTQIGTERYIRIEGLNKADGSAIVADFYRVVFDPLKDFDFVTKTFAKIQVDGTILIDTTRPSTNAPWGQYFSVKQV